MREQLGDKVFDATMDSIKTEIAKPDFDPSTSPLTESHGGGGSLLLLLEEIFGFGKEASHHIVSS